jgi:hypothetical protein
MVSRIVAGMTDEQRRAVAEAEGEGEGGVICKTEGNGRGLWRGLVTVAKGEHVALVVADTGLAFDDEAEALATAEDVVDAVLGTADDEGAQQAAEMRSEDAEKSEGEPESGEPEEGTPEPDEESDEESDEEMPQDGEEPEAEDEASE